MAGAAGFEPANAGTKNRCLTAWRRPSMGCPGLGHARGAAYSGHARLEKPKSGASATVLAPGRGKLGGTYRSAKMETLQLIAAQLPHHLCLGLRFNTFRGGFHAQATS